MSEIVQNNLLSSTSPSSQQIMMMITNNQNHNHNHQPEENGISQGTPITSQINMQYFCRICAEYDSRTTMLSIYESDGIANEIGNRINFYLPIEISELDSLSLKICTKCWQTLLEFHELYLKCLDSKEKFHQIFNSNNSENIQLQNSQTFDDIDDLELIKQRQNQQQTVDKDTDLPIPTADSIPKKQPNQSCRRSIRRKINQSNKSTTKKSQNNLANNKYPCNHCSESFQLKKLHIEHIKDVHTDLIFHCDVCSEYIDRTELIAHMTYHALVIENQEQKHSQQQQQQQQLQQHQQNNNNKHQKSKQLKKTYKCDQCDKKFANRSGRRYHIITIHENRRDFQCEMCSMSFACKRTLSNHLNSLHSQQPRLYQCDQCTRNFTTDSGLYGHRKTHDLNYLAQCDLCLKRFKFTAQLRRHVAAVHIKEKTHFCQFCNKSFGSKNNLTKHLKTHSNVYEFRCHICSYEATQRRYLAEHMKHAHHTKLAQ